MRTWVGIHRSSVLPWLVVFGMAALWMKMQKKMRSRVTGVSMINMMIPPSPRPNGPSRSRPKFYILNNSKTFAWQCNMMSSPNKDSGV